MTGEQLLISLPSKHDTTLSFRIQECLDCLDLTFRATQQYFELGIAFAQISRTGYRRNATAAIGAKQDVDPHPVARLGAGQISVVQRIDEFGKAWCADPLGRSMMISLVSTSLSMIAQKRLLS